MNTYTLYSNTMNKFDCETSNCVKIFDVRNSLIRRQVQIVEKSRVGCYSLHRKCNQNGLRVTRYREDNSAMKYLCLPTRRNFCLDLIDGYSGPHWFRHSDDSLPFLLKWIKHNKKDFLSNPPDFVCFRGLLTLVMLTPFERVSDWWVHGVKFNDTIYMVDKATGRRIYDDEHRSEYQDKACYGGFRFERYISRSKQYKVQKPNSLNDLNHNQCNVVMKTVLNGHSCLYPAEVDCKNSDGLVEIKTTKEITSRRQWDTFVTYKTVKWWSQSYLAGVRSVVCGFRDPNFKVRRIEKYPTEFLCAPEDSYTCLNFLDWFLQLVKDCIKETNVTYDFYWSPFNNEIQFRITSQKDTLLPEWYRNAFLQ